jgi:hypothetical protein
MNVVEKKKQKLFSSANKQKICKDVKKAKKIELKRI